MEASQQKVYKKENIDEKCKINSYLIQNLYLFYIFSKQNEEKKGLFFWAYFFQ